jgi:hypothetical protein
MKNIILSLALFSAFNANANLIVDGSFESYSVPTSDYEIYSTPTGAWLPSTGAPTAYLEVRNTAGEAQEGSNFVELNPLAPSGITQSFNASAGLGTVSWWSASRFSSSSYAYQVLLNDVSIFSGSASSVTSSTSRWSQNLLSGLTLLEGTNTLTFNSLVSGDIGAHIDNVSVMQTSIAAIPEPETYAMFLAGLGLLGFAARRRQS